MTTAVDYGQMSTVTVYFDELDAMGILHNARYAVLLERALIEFWSARGHTYERGEPSTSDSFNAVREYSITYHAPIRGTGPVIVHFWLDKFGTSSAVYGFRFLQPDTGKLYAEGHRAIVKLDPKTMRPTPWSDDAREIAQLLEKRLG